MVKQFWPVIVLLLVLTGCGSGGAPTRENDITPVTSIEIVVADSLIKNSSIAFGTSTKLTVNGNHMGLFSRPITSGVTWTSDKTDVASFDTATDPNRVTSHTPGFATLTATAGTLTATFKLTVTSATISSIAVNPANPSVPNGLTQPFTAIGTFLDSTSQAITTQDLTFDATWDSSDTSVATISKDAASKRIATTLKTGSTTISATFNSVPGTTTLKVTDPIVQSITVTTLNSSILSLSSGTFQAKGVFSNNSTANITSQVTWSSSQPTIATVAATGAVTTLLPGTTSISATLGTISGAADLKVTGGKLTAISLNLPSLRMVQNTLGRITAIGTFDNGTTRDITGVVVWSVDNTYATVTTASGNLTFVNALLATPTPTLVSATSGTITSSNIPNLTVVNPTLQAISISPTTTMNLSVSGSYVTSGRFTVSGNFSDGTTQDLTANAAWSSSSDAIATVGNTDGNTDLSKGRVTGIAAGSATISAKYGGQTVTAPVTVTQRTLSSLASITGGPSSSAPGSQGQFMLSANFNGAIQDVTELTDWSIDNSKVAILADSKNQPGLVTLVDSGTAKLTAKFGGMTQTITITVP